MTARRLPDIAADLLTCRSPNRPPSWFTERADELVAHAAEHVCVPKDRWPTADEIAAMRADAIAMRANGWEGWAARLDRFLDRLNPPEPEPQAQPSDWEQQVLTMLAEGKRPPSRAVEEACRSYLERLKGLRATEDRIDALEEKLHEHITVPSEWNLDIMRRVKALEERLSPPEMKAGNG